MKGFEFQNFELRHSSFEASISCRKDTHSLPILKYIGGIFKLAASIIEMNTSDKRVSKVLVILIMIDIYGD